MPREGNINILLEGNAAGLRNALNEGTRDVNRFTNHVTTQFRTLNRMTKGLAKGNIGGAAGVGGQLVGSLAGGLVGGLVGGAVVTAAIHVANEVAKAAKEVGEFEDSIHRVAINANLSAKETYKFKDEVFSVGMQSGVTAEELVKMSSAAYNSSRNFDFVSKEMGFMSKVAQASGSDAGELGDALGELQEVSGATGKVFEDMVVSLGAFSKSKLSKETLGQFLPSAKDLIKNAKIIDPSMGPRFQKILMEGMMTGDPQLIAKAYAKLLSPKQNKFLRQLGLNPKDFHDITEVISKIMGTAGRTEKEKFGAIGRVLGIKNPAELEPIVSKLREIDSTIASLDRKGFMAGATEQAHSFSGAMAKLHDATLKMKDDLLGPAIKEFGKAFDQLDPADLKALGEAFASVGKFIGETVVGLLKIPSAIKLADEAINNSILKTFFPGAAEKEAKAWGNGPIQVTKPGGQKSLVGPGSDKVEVTNNIVITLPDGMNLTPKKVISHTSKTGAQGGVASGLPSGLPHKAEVGYFDPHNFK
jgi:hypothetical protein